jgi:hypothetical protein
MRAKSAVRTFEMPEELTNAAFSGRLVVFAGAGVSTESSSVGGHFLGRVTEELGLEDADAFPAVMTAYESRHGRARLLQRIREHIDYVEGFPELWRRSTRFHHTLATAFFLDQIITTNWDTYFEDVSASIPIVVPSDYAFWDLPGRKVFKLHGSLNNLSSIVATDDDYDRCYRRLRTGVIGATLKHLLATKRAVFIGYSFGDPDLNRILRFLRREMADVLPRSYLVTPHGYNGSEFPADRVINTDGSYFVHKLKEAAVEANLMRPDTVFMRTIDLASRVADAHDRTSREFIRTRKPALVHALAYQDGLLHAFERIVAKIPSGHYSNPHSTFHLVPSYEAVVRGAVRKRAYIDASYGRGYLNAMKSLDLDDEHADTLPLYIVWGMKDDLRDFREFKRAADSAGDLHKGATEAAAREIREIPKGVVPHHPAFLDAQGYAEAGI